MCPYLEILCALFQMKIQTRNNQCPYSESVCARFQIKIRGHVKMSVRHVSKECSRVLVSDMSLTQDTLHESVRATHIVLIYSYFHWIDLLMN